MHLNIALDSAVRHETDETADSRVQTLRTALTHASVTVTATCTCSPLGRLRRKHLDYSKYGACTSPSWVVSTPYDPRCDTCIAQPQPGLWDVACWMMFDVDRGARAPSHGCSAVTSRSLGSRSLQSQMWPCATCARTAYARGPTFRSGHRQQGARRCAWRPACSASADHCRSLSDTSPGCERGWA